MSIVVTSNIPDAASPEIQAKGTVGSVDQSAPGANAPEQKHAAKSDAAATEAKNDPELDAPESDDSDESDGEGTAKSDKPRKKGGFQRRIDKLNARYTAAQAEIEHWKQQALKGAGATDSPKVDAPAKSAEPAGKPDPASFETHAEYVEAIADWKLDQREKAAKAEAAKAQAKTEQEQTQKAHVERVKSFAEKATDFHDVIAEVDDVPVSDALREIIVTSENGPELMYELAKNRAEYERINALSPVAAARELGKLEARLAPKASDEKKPEQKKTTQAPKPIAPIGGGKGGPVEKSIDEIAASGTQAEYEAARLKQMKQRRSTGW